MVIERKLEVDIAYENLFDMCERGEYKRGMLTANFKRSLELGCSREVALSVLKEHVYDMLYADIWCAYVEASFLLGRSFVDYVEKYIASTSMALPH